MSLELLMVRGETKSLGVLGEKGGGGGTSWGLKRTLLLASSLNFANRGRGGLEGTLGKILRNHNGCFRTCEEDEESIDACRCGADAPE